MSKHTRGQWVLDGRNVLGKAFDGSLRCIARVSGQSPAEADANARLIASAPDLLAALEQCVDAMWDTSDIDDLREEASEQARAAIARAKG